MLASEDDQMGVIFQCHSDIQKPSMERSMCAGWLLDQKKRDLPSISLRLSMRTDDSVAQAVQNQVLLGQRPPIWGSSCMYNTVRKKPFMQFHLSA